MFVRRLSIENWKNFPKGEVNLSRRLFLIGPNASGKSNFLDIFRFLRDLSLSKGGGLPGIGGEEVLRLEPSPDGTLLRSPLDEPDELELLKSGLTIADVVLPKSAPSQASQLELVFN
jgi:AAA domain, putative AbiEii toxin, Type IV TA system